MTITIAHLADTHLGYQQYGLIEREKDFYDSFENIIDDIIDKNVDYVIHSGDLFEHSKPPINALLCAQKGFLRLIENNIKIIVIAGNHDIVQKRETSIPQELYKNENFTILNHKNRVYEINEDIVIAGIQFIRKSLEESVKQILYEIQEEVQGYKHKILMLHGSTRKHFELNPEFELDTIPEGFDYYAMGHLHKRILEKDFKGGILSYPGSTDIREKGEISDYDSNGKGYNLLTIDDELKVEYVNIPLERKFIVESIKYPELDNKLDELEYEIKNDILTKYEKKPVLLINVKEGDFDKSEVSEKVYDKLKDLSLIIKLTYNPDIIIHGPSGENPKVRAEELIIEHLKEFKDEKITNLGLDLYKTLSQKNTEEAEEISERFYKKYYYNIEGEKNDN
ncbi:MAG: hypothetical protein BZ135_06475 [Methanosphaera sp. rholeuAM6]|nr:MAG: hypothetical protein BZ135_06475 [Methanosphaera sp. rholeuAM6]